MIEVVDAIVVGLGAMGSAATYQLAQRGLKVIGIDRFAPPHDHGSSHGETRITRQAVGEGAAYVPLVLRSHQIWRELEAKTGENLFLPCGTLVISPQTGAAAHHNKTDFLGGTIACARRFGIEHEVLTADGLRSRYPQFGIDDDVLAYHEPGGGLVFPERCIATQLKLASQLGASLRTGERVIEFTPTGSGIRLKTDKGLYEAAKVVMTAGAWMSSIVGAPLKQLGIQRQTLHWFEAERPELYASERFPVFIWIHGSGPEDLFYGFPTPPGGVGVKVAAETTKTSSDEPEAFSRIVSATESRSMFETHVAGRLRMVSPNCIRSAACLYTVTPDADFVIDHHPDTPDLLLASPCSGHGFKHSAAIGEVLAARVVGEEPLNDVSAFSLSRFASIRQKNDEFIPLQ